MWHEPVKCVDSQIDTHYIHVWHSDNNTVKVVHQHVRGSCFIWKLDSAPVSSGIGLLLIFTETWRKKNESLGDWAAKWWQVQSEKGALLCLISKFVGRRTSISDSWTSDTNAKVYVLLAWLVSWCQLKDFAGQWMIYYLTCPDSAISKCKLLT